MEDDFAIRYVRIYPVINSRAELVTLAPGLRPERHFEPLARGLLIPAAFIDTENGKFESAA